MSRVPKILCSCLDYKQTNKQKGIVHDFDNLRFLG